MKNKFIYQNVLRLGTLQFDGHVHDYFVNHTERLVEYYLLPRGGGTDNFIAVYNYGKLDKKYTVYSPSNIVLTYLFHYYYYVKILFTQFDKHDRIYFINCLPIFFFFNSFWKLFRPLTIVYWVQDYWPMDTFAIGIFRWFMHYYHQRSRYAIYLTDRINKVMNNKIVKTTNKHTVMLGMEKPNMKRVKKPTNTITLCFIGVLKVQQDIELLLRVVHKNPTIRLVLIGTGDKTLVKKYRALIKKLQIQSQVSFPNTFIYGSKLKQAVSACHIGIVLYQTDKNTATYYADPSKLKQYAEFGLPIITTRSSETALYISRFKAGIVVSPTTTSITNAIFEIQKNYSHYLKGIDAFSRHFSYSVYYQKSFKFMERDS